MSDTQRDREERQHVIEVLKQMRLDYEDFWEENDTEEIKAFNYAIASIETDLKYDLLYEETSGQADKPTTKDYLGVDYLGVDAISRQAINGYIDYILSHEMGKKKSFDFIKKFVANLPPTTSQEPCKDCISRQALIDWLKNWTLGDATPLIDFVNSMPPVTPQLSSGLEKNSKKLEKDFGESDCISRAEVLKLMQDNWHTHNGDWAMQESMDDIRALPSVTPQEPRKGHWIEHPRTKELRFHHIYECSACKTQIIGNRYNVGNYKYCPYCGIEFEVEG